jgi:hypothetical protein
MKYEIGDNIIVLHSDEEGKVVEIINEKMVLIEVRGVRFPAYMDQIDFPYFKMFTKKKLVEKKKIHVDNIKKEKQAVRKKVADGVFLNFIPVYDKDIFEDDVVEKLKVFLINYNEEEYHFKYKLVFSGEFSFELNSTVLALNDFYLNDLSFEDVNDSPSFEFEFSLVNPNKKKSAYFERNIKLKGKQVFKKIEEIQAKQEPSFSYELFLHYPEKVDEEKVDLSKLGNAGYRFYDISKAKSYIPSAQSVIDLHIEKITENYKQLTHFEIFTLQLETFEKFYERALLNHLPSMIVIHGIGEGKLRNEIHEILRTKKNVKSFVNQYHHLYGFGATEIFFNP